jgi:hypothetical protein
MHWRTEPPRVQMRNANGHGPGVPIRKERCRLCGRGFQAYRRGLHAFHRSCSERYKELQDNGMLE